MTDQNPSPVTIAFCSLAFRNEPIEDLVQPLAEIGYDAIEVFGGQVLNRSEDDLDRLRDLAAQHGIGLLGVAPYFALTRGQTEYDETMQTAEKTVSIARRIGATKVRTFTDVGPDGLGLADATEKDWDQAVRGLQAITAMDRDLQFVLETHPHTLAETVASVEQLIARVDAPNLKVNFQPIQPFVDYGINAAFDRLRPHITHLHLHQIGVAHGQGWLEESGTVDFPDFLGHVLGGGYRASMSVEYCWKDVTWERAKSGHDYLRSVIADVQATA